MKFTDDDLKRLKGLLTLAGCTLSENEARALIARLEAAERRFIFSHDSDVYEASICTPECKACGADDLWRKAAGK